MRERPVWRTSEKSASLGGEVPPRLCARKKAAAPRVLTRVPHKIPPCGFRSVAWEIICFSPKILKRQGPEKFGILNQDKIR